MEIMIAIAVLAILTTIALPSFRTAIQNNRLTGQANEIVASMQFARSEALKRGLPVGVCASSNGLVCGGSWNQGWMAFTVLPGDAIEPLRVWPGSGNDFQFDPTPVDGQVRYEPNGFANAAFRLDIELPDCTGDNARQITVAATGRAASERVACS